MALFCERGSADIPGNYGGGRCVLRGYLFGEVVMEMLILWETQDIVGALHVFTYYTFLLMILVSLHSSAASLSPYDISKAWAKAQADTFFLSCSPDRPIISQGESVQLKAWAANFAGRPSESGLTYTWSVRTGRISNTVTELRWELKNTKPGNYLATVRATDNGAEAAECSVQIIVESSEQDIPDKGRRSAHGRETGKSFLLPTQHERKGYGLYSYLILGGPPSDNSRGRYLKTIEAYLALLPDVIRLEKYFAPSELNITYLPINDAPPSAIDTKVLAEWVLDHYDYARARSLIRHLRGDNRDGPYVVSVSVPLSERKPLSDYLWQDLSGVPAQLAGSWIKEFMNQAAQERFWETRNLPQLRLKIRGAIAVFAMALPDVQNSLDSYIKMRYSVSAQ